MMHNSSNKKLKQQKVKPKMDGLARPGASKGVLKSTHVSGGAFIREPGGPSTHELGGLGTCGPGGLSSHDLLKSFTRSDTSRTQPIQKGQSYNWLKNEANRNSFSSYQSPAINHGEEDDQEDTYEINNVQTETDTSDDELEDNIGS
nr:hypothetical protein [Tanacetum cinerariifolium]